jgi:hypothetical protein
MARLVAAARRRGTDRRSRATTFAACTARAHGTVAPRRRDAVQVAVVCLYAGRRRGVHPFLVAGLCGDRARDDGRPRVGKATPTPTDAIRCGGGSGRSVHAARPHALALTGRARRRRRIVSE